MKSKRGHGVVQYAAAFLQTIENLEKTIRVRSMEVGAVALCVLCSGVAALSDDSVPVKVYVSGPQSAVCGASVALADDYGMFDGKSFQTNKSGSLTLTVPSGRTVIAARHPQLGRDMSVDYVDANYPRTITLHLPGSSIAGTVKSSVSGKAVRDVEVVLDPTPEPNKSPAAKSKQIPSANPKPTPTPSVSPKPTPNAAASPSPTPTPSCTPLRAGPMHSTTDIDGRFEFNNVLAGAHVVTITRRSASAQAPKQLTLASGESKTTVDFSLTLPVITGTVRDYNGLPIPGGVVTLTAAGPASSPVPGDCASPDMVKAAPHPVLSASVATNNLGQYDFEDVDACTIYTVDFSKSAFGMTEPSPIVSSSPELGMSMPSRSDPTPPSKIMILTHPGQTAHHSDIAVSPPVAVIFGEEANHFVVGFNNRTKRNVTAVFWIYDCHNIAQCNAENTQNAPADYQSMHSFLLRPGEYGKTYTFDRNYPYQDDSDFSAKVSYCYFNSAEYPGDLAFDVISWVPKPQSTDTDRCRTILASPQPVK